jgi:hypothetical protein
MKMASELGTIDPGTVKKSFARLDDKFAVCQTRGIEHISVLAGTAKFFLRIGSDGAAKWAYLEDSDIGDAETERCLVRVVMDAQWPQPDGGDAEVRYSLELALNAQRPPNDWPADKVTSAIARQTSAIDRCKQGSSATFRATLYVGPGGRVLTAGIATSSREGVDKSECLEKVLLKLHGLPTPGSWPAKVSFGL